MTLIYYSTSKNYKFVFNLKHEQFLQILLIQSDNLAKKPFIISKKKHFSGILTVEIYKNESDEMLKIRKKTNELIDYQTKEEHLQQQQQQQK